MSHAPFTVAAAPPTLIDDDHPPRPGEARALLEECAERFVTLLAVAARGAMETTDDLFEPYAAVPEGDVQRFRQHRGTWAERFERTLDALVRRRLAGTLRKGRRPDADVSAATLRVLSAFDQERQAAIVRAASALASATRREMAALDRRVALLLGERVAAGLDNPFGIAYLLDAIGALSRAVYPDPRVWRPLMERLLDDLKPAFVKTCITLNRHLAERGVLPEIKAALRARSDLRPADDADLLPLFEQLLREGGAPAGAPPLDVAVPTLAELRTGRPGFAYPALQDAARARPAAAADAPAPGAPAGAQTLAPVQADVARALVAAYARHQQRVAATPASATSSAADGDDLAFPQLDSMMALGGAGAMISELDQWQRFDPEQELGEAQAAPDGEAVKLPLNRLPVIRDAIAGKIANPADRLTMDVVGLLFDYIFRDPSIPDALRRIFARLQVPIAKAALLDRSFFSDRRHPARRLLDDLAAAAVGAHGDARYEQEFQSLATDVVDGICADFGIDVFDAAVAQLRPFAEREQAATAAALHDDIDAALGSEVSNADRAHVRALLRDRLAGLDVPFEVHRFVETVWADHLAAVRAREGRESEAWQEAMSTLDDLLWSIAAKERTAQKARLTRLIPSLVQRLRAGVAAAGLTGDRMGSFFEALYRLHVEVLRPSGAPSAPSAPATARPRAAVATVAGPAARGPDAGASGPKAAPPVVPGAPAGAPFEASNVHDFVSEMAIGTWLLLREGEHETPARLMWVSPLRTRYIFTARGRAKAIALTPEELAWQLGSGRAALIVEPVPLFDRAVSAALDALAAQAPAGAGAR